MALKRKQPSVLDRRVRARRDEEENIQSDSEASDSAPSEEAASGSESDSDSNAGSDNQSSSDPEHDAPPQPKVDLSSVSFGALARAQAALPSNRKSKSKSKSKTSTDDEPPSRFSRPEKAKPDGPRPSRSSKHAPQEQSSKRPVTRRREILPDLRRKYRDPRFDPLMGEMDESKARKAYSFLDEYRDSELADLKAQVKKTKNPDEKERLKRQVLSMESKKKARVRKDEEDQLLSEHRKKEKELVAQGKQPFYLKRSEQKKQLLTNRFEGMSKGAVDRAIERKRKKVAGKEKKELDFLTRRR